MRSVKNYDMFLEDLVFADVFEATVSGTTGQVSQSGQWAPFNYEYIWDNTTENYIVYNSTGTSYNTYMGGAYQQSTSSLTDTGLWKSPQATARL